MHRHLSRLEYVKKNLSVGKMSGAVGTGAAFGKKFFDIQSYVMTDLGLNAEMPATQIVGRDRYIELLSYLANVTTSIEKFATEIRNLQRSEIAEVEEFFGADQVGSSTMPHKRNPINCEQICGLARLVRANVLPSYENAIQWHERDLSNSSSERFILPHSLILTDWILFQMRKVFSTLRVYPKNMLKNIEDSKGLIFAETIMIKMVETGMSRQDAHELMRRLAMKAKEKNIHLKQIIKEHPDLTKKLKNIDEIFQVEKYIGESKKLVDLTVKKIQKELLKTKI
jgi:adenylosuccinate lyase